jgi:hypothetical protein
MSPDRITDRITDRIPDQISDRALDRILSLAADEDFAHYQPQPVIAAVNALLPLGKDGALAAIESHLAEQNLETDSEAGLFLVLRTLFEVPNPPGYHPPLRLGGSSPPPPSDSKSLPHFPLVLIDDRPLLMVTGFALGGDTEPVSTHIEHFRAAGTLRKQPLAPSQSSAAVLEQFETLYRHAYGKPPSPHEIAFIEAQLGGREP